MLTWCVGISWNFVDNGTVQSVITHPAQSAHPPIVYSAHKLYRLRSLYATKGLHSLQDLHSSHGLQNLTCASIVTSIPLSNLCNLQ